MTSQIYGRFNLAQIICYGGPANSWEEISCLFPLLLVLDQQVKCLCSFLCLWLNSVNLWNWVKLAISLLGHIICDTMIYWDIYFTTKYFKITQMKTDTSFKQLHVTKHIKMRSQIALLNIFLFTKNKNISMNVDFMLLSKTKWARLVMSINITTDSTRNINKI